MFGFFEFKSVDEPMEIFALVNEGLIVPDRKKMEGKLKEIKKLSARKKWMVTALTILVLVAAFFSYKRLTSIKGFSGGDKTVAVLPFENVGVGGNEQYLSDGVTQDIITSLSKISSLQKVTAWLTVKSFKKTTILGQ